MLKVLFAASEAAPIAKVGGLGDVAGALPKALHKLKIDIRVVIPHYRSIDAVGSLPSSRVPVYYVHPGKYFNREEIYGYEDDIERFSYFSEEVLKLAKKEKFEPDIIHVNDYHTSLIPSLLKSSFSSDPFFAQTRTVLTLHNLSNKGGILLEQGIISADLLVAVSPTYAKEILTSEYGEGLETALKTRQDRLFGVLNGIDTESYDPATDPNLVSKFALADLEKRAINRISLIEELKFKEENWPVFGIVARLVPQKGLDLLLEIVPELSKLPLNLAILGIGDPELEARLKKADVGLTNMSVKFEFNEGLARRIYGGSDFFLIPSRFEPSGLTQMIAMRYGSIPVVHKTGGLADTVFDGKNGLVFESNRSGDLLATIKRALEIYQNKEERESLQRVGMREDFSWDRSAKEYLRLYNMVQGLPK